MGYETRYRLTVRDETPRPIGTLLSTSEEAEFCLHQTGATSEPGNWYKHESEIIAHSLLFPYHVFTLHGEGEESGDIWDKHFKNGKMQVCKAEVACPPFDESKLE